MRRKDEDVLKVEAGLGEERGIGREEKREADRLLPLECEEALGCGPAALGEERREKLRLGRLDLVRELLELGQSADKPEDQGDVGRGCWADGHGRIQSPGPR